MMRVPIEPSLRAPTTPSMLWALAVATSVLAFASPGALAQSAPPGPAAPVSSPKPEDLEPGVNTSSPADPSAESGPMAPKAPPDARARAGSTRAATPAAPAASVPNRAATQAAAAEKLTTQAAAPAANVKAGRGSGKAQDRIELDTTQITGNRELPKVLYIVPWKRSDLGDLVGKPVNSLLDEVLTPVDRDVFKRENRYYDALKPDSTAAAPGAAADRH